jgi:hypothetical protein
MRRIFRKNMTGKISEGSYNLIVTGPDPSIISPPDLGIDANKYKFLRIGMKNNTSDDKAQIFFITNKDLSYNSKKSVYFEVVPNDSAFTEYVIPMGNHEDWKDVISQLRVDVLHSVKSGTVQIDYIRITEN